MKQHSSWPFLLRNGVLASALLLLSAAAYGQAPPGPIQGPPSRDPAPAPVATKAKPAAPRTPREPRDFSGAWRLNHDDSDDPRQKQDEEQRSRQRDSGGFGGRRGGIGYPGGGYGGGGRRDSDDDRERLRPAFNPWESLNVTQKEGELDLSDDSGAKQTFFTDGRKVEKSKDPTNVQTPAKWDVNRLTTEEKLSNGRKLIRTYELSPEGDQLFETFKIDNRSGYPLSIRYVYDSVPQTKP